MIAIKTGMTDEAAIARSFSAKENQVLTGYQNTDSLETIIPHDCVGIISFGLCGGLAPCVQIGQTVLCTTLVTPNGSYRADPDWLHRLFLKTKYYECHWYSSGEFNTADTPAQRKAIFDKTGAWVIDDETYMVAQFAKSRGIPFAAMRSCSDGYNDTVPLAARNALNPDGSSNLESVLASLAQDPGQVFNLIKIGEYYNTSLSELRTAALTVGPDFCFK